MLIITAFLTILTIFCLLVRLVISLGGLIGTAFLLVAAFFLIAIFLLLAIMSMPVVARHRVIEGILKLVSLRDQVGSDNCEDNGAGKPV